MKKPFSIEELVARIENQIAIHRGNKKLATGIDIIKIGKYNYHPSLYELKSDEETIKLSHRESQVLSILCAHKNHVTDRKNLLMSVWGDDSFFNSRNLDVYIRKLSQYFKDEPGVTIETLKGKGYLFLIDE